MRTVEYILSLAAGVVIANVGGGLFTIVAGLIGFPFFFHFLTRWVFYGIWAIASAMTV